MSTAAAKKGNLLAHSGCNASQPHAWDSELLLSSNMNMKRHKPRFQSVACVTLTENSARGRALPVQRDVEHFRLELEEFGLSVNGIHRFAD